MRKFRLACVVEKDEDGYIAYCPQLQGCYAQGETHDEAIENLRDAMKLHIDDRLARNEPIPSTDLVEITSIEVTA